MNPRLHDSYQFRVWLSGSAVAFLDATFPNDERDVAIAKVISRAMKQAANKQPPSRAAMQRPSDPPPPIKQTVVELRPRPINTDIRTHGNTDIIETTPKVQAELQPVTPQKPLRGTLSSENPIGQLQVLCQQNSAPLPDYVITQGKGGFVCECSVSVLAQKISLKGSAAATKKAAKRSAAIAALKKLGFTEK